VARPHHTYTMYKARIFSEDDQLLELYENTLPALVKQCAQYFLDFDSAAVIRRSFDKANAYAKAYQAVKDLSFPKPPCFVHITLANPISKQ
jgi:hypothetical protein